MDKKLFGISFLVAFVYSTLPLLSGLLDKYMQYEYMGNLLYSIIAVINWVIIMIHVFLGILFMPVLWINYYISNLLSVTSNIEFIVIDILINTLTIGLFLYTILLVSKRFIHRTKLQ